MFKSEFKKGCMLVIGGAKSGKSSFALDVCNAMDGDRIFLATAQPLDDEMKERIIRHQAERDRAWLTVEEPLNIAAVIEKLNDQNKVILLDCLTLWINNLFMEYGDDQKKIESSVEDIVKHLPGMRGAIIVVSNEVGSGIIPDNPLARRYRDMVGSANQRIASISKKVVTVIAGLPFILKDR
ncbi:MAG: bifunctional adenosylcobinamide kinase/adenosylcobinamide-phosphate guanylyltransferase [Thermodesulfobacteriota bacterium]|nr:bifunctional adenosylcobinamide kinase/adenosylcobinamide-phosphate guanylyltransferase [Thermodesulfobacteriota bacterium]